MQENQIKVNDHGDLVLQGDRDDEQNGDPEEIENDQLLVLGVGTVDDERRNEERGENEDMQFAGGQAEVPSEEEEVGGGVDADQRDDGQLDVVDEGEVGFELKHLGAPISTRSEQRTRNKATNRLVKMKKREIAGGDRMSLSDGLNSGENSKV